MQAAAYRYRIRSRAKDRKDAKPSVGALYDFSVSLCAYKTIKRKRVGSLLDSVTK